MSYCPCCGTVPRERDAEVRSQAIADCIKVAVDYRGDLLAELTDRSGEAHIGNISERANAAEIIISHLKALKDTKP